MQSYNRFQFQKTYIYRHHPDLSTNKLKDLTVLVAISFFTVTIASALYATSASVVFAFIRNYTCGDAGGGKVACCTYIPSTETTAYGTYCTHCDNTKPPSHCGPRYKLRTTDVPPGSPTTPTLNDQLTTTNAAPLQSPPIGNNTTNNGTSIGMKAIRGVYSPTGGCVPGGSTCIPCDPGLASRGANCIPSGDWRPGGSELGTQLGGGGSSVPPTIKPPAQSGVTEQPPTNLAPPSLPPTPQTTPCPDGSQPDVNGQCPTTTGNQNPQSLTNNNNGGGDNGNNNNNNILSQQQNNKGSNLLGHAGELAGNKKGSSPTPPPCPTDNSPIPPNCTLKPKF
jgi:hypothetical protein